MGASRRDALRMIGAGVAALSVPAWIRKGPSMPVGFVSCPICASALILSDAAPDRHAAWHETLTPPDPEPGPDPTPGWVDTFRHTFAGSELDLAVWHYEGELMNVKPHGTQQLDGPNLPRNVYVNDGLEIRGVREHYHSDESNMDYEWTAGGIQSNDELFHIGERIIFKHRAQVVPGMSPGWWTSSGHDDGEFDVPEMFGLMPDLWSGPASGYRYNAFKSYSPLTQKQFNQNPADEEEHESIAYWKPDNSAEFYYDGELVHTIGSDFGLPQTPQRIRVTLQVGGNAQYRGAIPDDVDGFSCWTSLIAVQRPA